ncbi:Hypothetical protein CINCED_3A000241 [Cinara cedri]|uniref:Uncharacterized protein n=1 Tax=Cinara cedri TaxID=506608 RepID=A0A5E4N0U2_9HEMI|nr:Hypothetical protein CINCED_3A000241 [Cinara cedri]
MDEKKSLLQLCRGKIASAKNRLPEVAYQADCGRKSGHRERKPARHPLVRWPGYERLELASEGVHCRLRPVEWHFVEQAWNAGDGQHDPLRKFEKLKLMNRTTRSSASKWDYLWCRGPGEGWFSVAPGSPGEAFADGIE